MFSLYEIKTFYRSQVTISRDAAGFKMRHQLYLHNIEYLPHDQLLGGQETMIQMNP